MNMKKISRFLSLVLRHKPEQIGLCLDRQGWADMDELISGAEKAGVHLDRGIIFSVAAESDKQRFAISADGRFIRASQGHSVSVDLGLKPGTPPEILWHGTAQRFLESIRLKGLIRGTRHHVHLSGDEETAFSVGKRHGKPVVLKIRSGEMHRAGQIFYLSDNGVWLTEHIQPEFIEFPAIWES
ncbi:MAG: RNA 2'-phosphotransferase [Desulfococcaceae bacterium]